MNKITQFTLSLIVIGGEIIAGGVLFYEGYSKISMILLVVVNFILFVSFLNFSLSKEYRLFKNVKRPIKVIKTDKNQMENEIATLKKIGFFNLSEPSFFDHKNLDMTDDDGLAILGYSPDMENFNNIVDKLENKKNPLIIYTKERLKDEHLEYLRKKSSWYSICNFPLKLSGDVFAILSTFPFKN